MYLFKFFLGRRAFFTKIKYFFHLGVSTYTYNVSLICKDRSIFDVTQYLMNNVFCYADTVYRSSGILSSSLKVFYLALEDLMLLVKEKQI